MVKRRKKPTSGDKATLGIAALGLGLWAAYQHKNSRQRRIKQTPTRASWHPSVRLVRKPDLQVVPNDAQTSDQDNLHAKTKDEWDGILEDLFVSSPTPSSMYPIRTGDTPESIAKAALKKVTGNKISEDNIRDYIYAFSSSRYNLNLYGSKSTSKSFPAKWIVPGYGKGIRGAFLPFNQDAIDLIAKKKKPKRTISDNCEAKDSSAESLGTIWLPPVCPNLLESQNVVTCAPFTWHDGSSAIEPDPDMTSRLGLEENSRMAKNA